MPPKIQLVCFDLGGVVVRICRSWAEGCSSVGIAERGDVEALCAASTAWPRIDEDHQVGRSDARAFAQSFSGVLDGLYSEDEIRQVHAAWILDEYPRVAALIEKVRAAGALTVALSNTCPEHWERLTALPALRAMDHRFASHLLGVRKPDVKTYRAVEEASEVESGAILFFDDSEANVSAARASGWNAERIDPGGDPAQQMTSLIERYGLTLRAEASSQD